MNGDPLESDEEELLDVTGEEYGRSSNKPSVSKRINPFNRSQNNHQTFNHFSEHKSTAAPSKPVLQFRNDDEDDDELILNSERTRSQSSDDCFENPWTMAHNHVSCDDDRMLVAIDHDDECCGPGVNCTCGESRPHASVTNDHCHVAKPYYKFQSSQARNRLVIASVVCFVFIIGEVIGGTLANSLAIMTDAAHMLSDFASFLISLFAIWFAKRPPTKKMSFGYHRAEVLGAVVSIMIIWVLTGVLVYMAVQRVIYQDYEIDTVVMLITSACGVAVNLVMGGILHGAFFCCISGSAFSHANHGHSHGGSKNINIRAAMIHVIGDLVQSVGVLIAAYIIHYKPEWKLADPICTFMFSLLVLFTTINVMKDAINVLMEGVPRELDYDDIKKELLSLPSVENVHNLNLWILTMSRNACSVHIAVGDDVDHANVMTKATRVLREKYDITQTTIQVERYDATIMATCQQCIGPSV